MSRISLLLVLGFLGAEFNSALPYSDENGADTRPVVPWVPTQPASKVSKPRGLPADVTAVLDAFRQALRAADWDKALSCCTAESQARAKETKSKEQYLRDFVPIQKLLAEPNYRCCGGKQATADGKLKNVQFRFFLRLSEPPAGETLSWEWSLERVGEAWLIELPAVSVEEWTKQEVARHRRQKEEAEAKWKALEPKLKGLRTQLTALQGELRVGQPMLFRLELVNAGEHDLSYDRQHVAVDASMVITYEDGSIVPYTAGPHQTQGGFTAIDAGATAVLFASLDIAKQYDMRKPGKYRVQFSGSGLAIADAIGTDNGSARRDFPSNTVEIDLRP